jgi:sugar-specific transcriptional regulator TrmB
MVDLDLFLANVGLTDYEAKIISTMFKAGEAEATDIARNAQVPKTRVYDVLKRLVGRGILMEVNAHPKRYRAIDPEDAVDKLVSGKKQELLKIEKEAINVKSNISATNPIDSGEKIMRVKDKEDFDKILAQELSRAKKSIHGLTSITDEHEELHNVFRDARKRNVSVRLLNSVDSKKLSNVCETKKFEHGMHAFVIDGKKVVLAISDFSKKSPFYHFTIMHDHAAVVKALLHYFEHNWKSN